MSAVRMCDRCGNIFSEREAGWSTFTGTRMERDENGRARNITEQIDTCSTCTIGSTLTPRLAVESATGVDRIARTQTQSERDALLGTGDETGNAARRPMVDRRNDRFTD